MINKSEEEKFFLKKKNLTEKAQRKYVQMVDDGTNFLYVPLLLTRCTPDLLQNFRKE
jgi:hypothetical protein